MKLMASGVTRSAASVRSPSFSRSSSSTTTTIRPARISSRAPGTSVNGASRMRSVWGMSTSYCDPEKRSGATKHATADLLQSRLGGTPHLYLEPGNHGCRAFHASKQKRATMGALLDLQSNGPYNVDSISNPQASRRASGMYLEFLFRRAHSRSRVDRIYSPGVSLNSFTICSKEVTVGTTGPMGSGLPQFGFPRRFAID